MEFSLRRFHNPSGVGNDGRLMMLKKTSEVTVQYKYLRFLVEVYSITCCCETMTKKTRHEGNIVSTSISANLKSLTPHSPHKQKVHAGRFVAHPSADQADLRGFGREARGERLRLAC